MDQIDIDAYQIAENTPKNRHSTDCKAFGVGAVVTQLSQANYCNCFIINHAKSLLNERYES